MSFPSPGGLLNPGLELRSPTLQADALSSEPPGKPKRQRNTAQMKEQGRNSQDQINKEEISNLPERELRIMIVKML